MNNWYVAPKMIMDDIAKLDSAMLFGSRSMASRPVVKGFDPAIMIGSQITTSTDWDFSASYSKENHDSLIKAGFTFFEASMLSYKDDLTTGVYIKEYKPKFNMRNLVAYCSDDVPVVNVVLRNDYALFSQVWNSIQPEFYYKHIWKRSPTYANQELGFTKETICDIMNQLFRTARHMI